MHIAIRRAAAIAALTLLAASPSACAQGGSRGKAAGGGADAEQTLKHDGADRTYLVHDFAQGGKAAVVIVLHGGGGNAENAVMMSQFDRIAAREKFIVVYPNGSGRTRLLTWNAGHCCAYAMTSKVDDVGFVSALIDRLLASGRADPSRIYVTGMSNGGMMSHRLGRELSGKVAAIAPVVGAVFGDEAPPAAPVPAFIIVGAVDDTVPPNGGPLAVRALLGPGQSAADRDVMPAFAQAEYWAKANGCSDPKATTTAASAKTEWSKCSSGAPVVFHSVANNGHAWPGGRAGRAAAAQPTQAFDASEEMWAFFKSQSRK